jgi:hypothetical protein
MLQTLAHMLQMPVEWSLLLDWVLIITSLFIKRTHYMATLENGDEAC